MAPRFASRPPEDPRRSPVNYSSRSVQLRLLAMVGTVFLVAMVFVRVRDPQFWVLLGFEERPIAGGAPLTEGEIANDSPDTQLPAEPVPENDLAIIGKTSKPTATVGKVAADPAEPPGRWGVAESDAPAELAAASRDAWRSLLGELDGDGQLLLYDVLDTRLAGGRVPSAERDAWDEWLDKAQEHWTAYCVSALDSLANLTEDEQIQWRKRLDYLNQRWPRHWRPLLETWIEPESAAIDKPASDKPASDKPASEEAAIDKPASDTEPVNKPAHERGAQAGVAATEPAGDPQLVAQLLRFLDEVTLASIRDNTVSRAAEKAVWFRWLKRLRDTPPEQLRGESLGPTGYLPLFKQPRDYRGKVVTVRGVIHLAYRVAAPKNRVGISHYYLCWLRPAGGPNSPIVVYSLELPSGFPAVKDKFEEGGMTQMHEEVEFTGLSFKRWAYQTARDIQVAPVVLAKAPRWQPPAVVADSGPSWATLGAILAVAAATGIGLALIAARRDPAMPWRKNMKRREE
ncbi:MAG: hypothetical protein ACKO38_19565 [Planctomycetota bacterium]